MSYWLGPVFVKLARLFMNLALAIHLFCCAYWRIKVRPTLYCLCERGCEMRTLLRALRLAPIPDAGNLPLLFMMMRFVSVCRACVRYTGQSV